MKADIITATFSDTGRQFKRIFISLMGELYLLQPHWAIGYMYIGTGDWCICRRIEQFRRAWKDSK